ncbi:MAG: hypothetical protein FWC43_08720 [Planctomycetaceae bacterium]|nr:hypothetical protein [Planctomycetaceae bacterium]
MPFLIFVTVVCFFSVHGLPSQSAGEETQPEESRSVFWLGFPIFGRDRQLTDIDLAQDMSFGSAFLLQLRRQAMMLAAREEFGALTRDAFLDEIVPEGAVRFGDVDKLASANVEYVDHRQFLADVEKRSRNEFVTTWRQYNLKKSQPATPTEEADLAGIEQLLCEWALIPQFEAVRRTHDAIYRHGESLPLLKLLVRGYTQLQMLTNFAPRDTHRVFQARAMLYAQRAVVNYGETPETLLLRASAWSLNNFHRIAREEFAAISQDELEKADTWPRLAKAYCEFDIKTIAAMTETADPETQRPFAKLLHFFLLGFAVEPVALTRPFGEKAVADLPNCARLYIETQDINTFDTVCAPDGSPFHEHLARRIAPAVRNMRDLPEEVLDKAKQLAGTVKKTSGGSFSLFGGRAPQQDFPLEQYYIDYAALLKSLREATTQNDPGEPSLSMLELLLRDDEMKIVEEVARGPDGTYSLQFGKGADVLPALAAFGGGQKLVLVISLKPDEEPDSMTPSAESNFVRVDMKKVADAPSETPVEPQKDTRDFSGEDTE